MLLVINVRDRVKGQPFVSAVRRHQKDDDPN